MSMKKIIVIGCPGGGKSTFARALSERCGLPLHHLDMMFWNIDRTTVERSVFLDRLSAVLDGDEWIIDGNYSSTMEMRIGKSEQSEHALKPEFSALLALIALAKSHLAASAKHQNHLKI